VALPPVGVSEAFSPNCIKPPELVKVALPAVELPSKTSEPLLLMVASPAVEVLPNFIKPLLMKVALPAVELLSNSMLVVVKVVRLPALALLEKSIFAPSNSKAKFCTIPELFVMPAPLMVNVGEVSGKFSIVNELAPGWNTIPLTSASRKMSRVV